MHSHEKATQVLMQEMCDLVYEMIGAYTLIDDEQRQCHEHCIKGYEHLGDFMEKIILSMEKDNYA